MHIRLVKILSLAAAFALSACQAPPQVLYRAFGDNKNWIVSEPMAWNIGQSKETVVVPKGFVTDFASIPQPFWSLGLQPQGQYSRAAVLHDYLYWSQGCTREQADRLLLMAMRESAVGAFDEVAVYTGVRAGGQGSWDSNTKERQAGLPRVVPERYLHPSDPNVLWPQYRAFLVTQGVKDPAFPKNPSYCAMADANPG